MKRNLKTMAENGGNNMERKVRKAVAVIGFMNDWEVLPRNYGYEIKVYNASAGKLNSLSEALFGVVGFGEYVVVSRKTRDWDCIRCIY